VICRVAVNLGGETVARDLIAMQIRARDSWSYMRRSVIATLIVVVGGAACSDGAKSDRGDSVHEGARVTAPRPIAGGGFEASGVTHVPGSNQVLFVDDGRSSEVFSMELKADGRQVGAATRVPLDADVTDLEGITSDGERFYVVGSQSKKTGFDGDGLVRFRFDAATRRTDQVERIRGLKAWLAANVAELQGTERRVGEDVLNIEGLAWDPVGGRLLLGLRAPVVDGNALVIAVRLADAAGPFSVENLRIDGVAIPLDLGGAGIRSIEYDAHAQFFRVIADAAPNDASRGFRLLEWDGKAGSATREIRTWNRRLKPEGITRATIEGQAVSVLVFDVGSFEVMK
jgi:hypothetical protein